MLSKYLLMEGKQKAPVLGHVLPLMLQQLVNHVDFASVTTEPLFKGDHCPSAHYSLCVLDEKASKYSLQELQLINP